jgi:hypothetical protein
MDIVPSTPFVDYYKNRLYITTEDGPTAGQNSLWVLNTLGPTSSGAADSTCRGMLVQSYGSLLDNNNTLWESYDGSTFFFQSGNGLLRGYDTSGNTRARISGSAVITNVVSGSPGFLIKSSVWEDYYKFLLGLRRLYFVTQDGGVWCVDDNLLDPGDFNLCPTQEWPDNPVYQNVNATGGPTPLAAGMLLEPHFWAGGGDNLGDHAGRGTLFQIRVGQAGIDGQPGTDNCSSTSPCGGTDKTFVVDSTSTLGDLSTSVAADALYVGTSAGRLYRINLSGSYGSLP